MKSKILITLILCIGISVSGCSNTAALDEQIAGLQTEIETLSASVIQYQTDLGIKDARIIELEGQVKDLSDKITELETQTEEKDVAPSTSPVETADDLAYYLLANYGQLETSMGVTSFTFDIHENNSINYSYDYWIQVEYDSSFFYDLQYDKDVTTEMNHKVCMELKNHQEELARAAIALMPDKKFNGGYYASWYKYPTLKLELITRHYYSWVNYTPTSALSTYDQTKVSQFQWYSLLDDSLTR